jgi:hypothetical protein
MGENDRVEDQPLGCVRDLADATAAQAREYATGARDRIAQIKRQEIAAHAKAIELHEQAAELQERLGRPHRAANARAHARNARELQLLALEEQREQGRVTSAGERRAVKVGKLPSCVTCR